MRSIRDETIAKMAGQKSDPEETIDGVKKKAEDMTVIDGALATARKLSGAGALQEQIERQDRKLEAVEEQRDKAIEDKHRAEIDKVEIALGAKIDGLAKAYSGGASKDSIADQISEIKKAATELGMGSSKVSEIREMMSLITTMTTQKSLADQIKDAKELINTIMPQPEKGKEFSIGGMPATIALELKKMDTSVQIQLEQMKDERQRRDQEFQLKVKQYDLERADKIGEAQAKIQIEQERNKMLAGGLETVGRAIGKGIAEGGHQIGGLAGSVAGKAAQPPKSYRIELRKDEAADFDCPNCSARIAVGPDSTNARCVGCNSTFPVVRKLGAEMAGPPPPSEEE